jgi:hypothetical protein
LRFTKTTVALSPSWHIDPPSIIDCLLDAPNLWSRDNYCTRRDIGTLAPWQRSCPANFTCRNDSVQVIGNAASVGNRRFQQGQPALIWVELAGRVRRGEDAAADAWTVARLPRSNDVDSFMFMFFRLWLCLGSSSDVFSLASLIGGSIRTHCSRSSRSSRSSRLGAGEGLLNMLEEQCQTGPKCQAD